MNDRELVEGIFRAAVRRVDPDTIIQSCVSIDPADNVLTVRTEHDDLSVDLGQFDRVIVVGAGKASARMARGIETVLGERLSEGIIAVKKGHVEKLQKVVMVEAGHPVPDTGSVDAGTRILGLLSEVDERSLVINLISGGGSALLALPAEGVTLDDVQQTTSILLASGAAIQEINCIRKHLSRVKGGRLAELAAPATVISLILSDVIGDDLSSIASGLTTPDPSTFADSVAIVERFGIRDALPQSVVTMLERGRAGQIADTPKPGDDSFRSVFNVLIGTNAQALLAAAEFAREHDLNAVIVTSQLSGEAKGAATLFAGIAADLVRFGGQGPVPAPLPACIIAGGETTVTIKGEGKGGRNQEMALAFLEECRPLLASEETITFLSAGTDGNDGPTDAAGGWADHTAATHADTDDIDLRDYLNRNDAYHALSRIGAHLITGPTNTNVCDIQILLVR